MDKRAVISVIALVTLGAGAGFLWRKQERARPVEPVQAPAAPAVATNPEPAATAISVQQLANKLRLSIKVGGIAGPNGSLAWASPADLQRRAEIRRRFVTAYPELATELQLEPEETERFLDLLARQQMEISALIESRPGSIRDGVFSDSLLRDIRTLELADDAEQAAMLAGKYPQWVQSQQAELQQSPVDQLQNLLVRQGASSLSDAEVDSLAAALAAEQKRLSRDRPGASEPPGNSPRQQLLQELQYTSNSRQLVKVASRFLIGQQLEAYKQLLEQRARTAQRLLRIMGDEAEE